MEKYLHRLPQYKIIEMDIDIPGEYIGVFLSAIRMFESWMGYLIDIENNIYKGKFTRIEQSGLKTRFLLTEYQDNSTLAIGNIFTYIDGYWGERVALVLDKTRIWEKKKFKNKDAIVYKLNGLKYFRRLNLSSKITPGDKIKTITNGWDHEHCAICQNIITEKSNTFGYLNKKDTWVCENCFHIYIEVNNIDFITEKAISQIIGIDCN